jgi:hypothetical protein
MRSISFLNNIRVILLIALAIRIIAAFFSKGYAFHDDHFCVLRVAESWTEGIGHWIESDVPPKHSMLYAMVNTAFLFLAKLIGITDPISKATFLQVLHAIYSVLIVYLGFKITERLSDRKNAILVAWILTILWFMPYLSVKFLPEMVCLPPLMYAFLLYLKMEDHKAWKWLAIGLLLGLAFSIRIHIVLLAGGMGLVLLYKKQFKEIAYIIAGFIVASFIGMASFDMIFFNYPYEYIANYFFYNSENAYDFVTAGPFRYFATVFGFLVPPVSIMLVWGYARSFKIEPAMFLGVLAFFIFHSLFPHKQERFILTMFPFLIILGTIGWKNFVNGSAFWSSRPSLRNGMWNFFWIINVAAALFLATNYTKKDRIAPLHFLSQEENVEAVLLEGRYGGTKMPPVYYMGEEAIDYNQFDHELLGYKAYWNAPQSLPASAKLVYTLDRVKSLDSVRSEFERMNRCPNFVVFYRQDSLPQRVENITELLNADTLRRVAEFEPSSLDKLLHFLNPRIHKRNDVYIYEVIQE